MSAYRVVTLTCDCTNEDDHTCEDSVEVEVNFVGEARKDVYKFGWRYRNGKDYCGGCEGKARGLT